jgi:hypothetical protein
MGAASSVKVNGFSTGLFMPWLEAGLSRHVAVG